MAKKIRAVVSVFLALSIVLGVRTFDNAYTVKTGDTLGKIAAENGTSVERLLEINKLENPNLIFPGDEIALSERERLSKEQIEALESVFDAEYYAEQNPDVVAVCGKEGVFEHFLAYGIWETRQPNADFNVNAYFSAYEDLREAFGELDGKDRILALYSHYEDYGKEEGRETTTIERALSENIEVLNADDRVTIVAAPKTESAPVSSNPPINAVLNEMLSGLHNMVDRYKTLAFTVMDPEDQNADVGTPELFYNWFIGSFDAAMIELEEYDIFWLEYTEIKRDAIFAVRETEEYLTNITPIKSALNDYMEKQDYTNANACRGVWEEEISRIKGSTVCPSLAYEILYRSDYDSFPPP